MSIHSHLHKIDCLEHPNCWHVRVSMQLQYPFCAQSMALYRQLQSSLHTSQVLQQQQTQRSSLHRNGLQQGSLKKGDRKANPTRGNRVRQQKSGSTECEQHESTSELDPHSSSRKDSRKETTCMPHHQMNTTKYKVTDNRCCPRKQSPLKKNAHNDHQKCHQT